MTWLDEALEALREAADSRPPEKYVKVYRAWRALVYAAAEREGLEPRGEAQELLRRLRGRAAEELESLRDLVHMLRAAYYEGPGHAGFADREEADEAAWEAVQKLCEVYRCLAYRAPR